MNRSGQAISVSRSGQGDVESDENLGKIVEGEEAWNVILWADHRAEEEAEKINATGEGVLGFVGKTMSVSVLLLKKRADYSWKWRYQRHYGFLDTWTRTSSKTACCLSKSETEA